MRSMRKLDGKVAVITGAAMGRVGAPFSETGGSRR
jgi:hypothetical protein